MLFKIKTKRNTVLSKFWGHENRSEKYGWDHTTDRNLRALGALSPGNKDECVTSITDITSKTAKDVWSFQCEMQKNDI